MWFETGIPVWVFSSLNHSKCHTYRTSYFTDNSAMMQNVIDLWSWEQSIQILVKTAQNPSVRRLVNVPKTNSVGMNGKMVNIARSTYNVIYLVFEKMALKMQQLIIN